MTQKKGDPNVAGLKPRSLGRSLGRMERGRDPHGEALPGQSKMCSPIAKIAVGIQETLFNNGNDFFASLLRDIRSAKTHIELETYTYNKYRIGTEVGEALMEASLRGVKVRLLVDGAGTPRWGGWFTKRLEKSGIQTRIFHPFPWGLWQWSRAVVHLPMLVKAIYLLLKMNARNHRKTCMIDGKIAYIGSFNIDHCHLKKSEGGKGWRDTGIRVQGIDLTSLQHAFESAWLHLPFSKRLQGIFKPINTACPIRLNNTRHARRLLYKNLLRHIAKARRRIWITNAYFVPDNFLLKKLKDVAQKGVDVRILLPCKSDVFMMPWASSTFYHSLLKANVRIFEYEPSMLHAKVLILDDWVMLGTSNLNHRSLLHDLEVDMIIQSEASRLQLESDFLSDLRCAREIQLGQWSKRPVPQRALGRVFLYLKYWI